jgi:hypothetical protein
MGSKKVAKTRIIMRSAGAFRLALLRVFCYNKDR